jgi:hypothetical protein
VGGVEESHGFEGDSWIVSRACAIFGVEAQVDIKHKRAECLRQAILQSVFRGTA